MHSSPDQVHEVPCPLYAASQTSPDAPAIVAPDQTLTYAELERWVVGTSDRLQALGCGPDVRVGCYLPNGWCYLVLLMAVIRVGGVACLLSTRVPKGRLGALLRQVDSHLLITDKSVDLDGVVVLQQEDVVREASQRAKNTPPDLPLGRPATIVFTSGSSGSPKAALHTFGNHYWSARGSNENIPLALGDRWLLSLPLYHVGGLAIFFRCLLAGATIVIPTSEALRQHPLATPDVTHASMVATQLYRLLQKDQPQNGALKALLLGGSAIPAGLLADAYARGLPIYTSYGLTEMASQVTTTPPNAPPTVLRTSGRTLPHRQLRIATDGEIWVRGATLFQGYVEEQEVRTSVDAEGWFHTGDVGRLDEGGYLYVQGRKDNLFISGGENIQPEEIEQALTRLEGVVQAVVVPVPDSEFGCRPVAFVRTGEKRRVKLTDLESRLEPDLPRFKIPIAFLPWPERGEGTAMKIDRARLKALALQSR